MIDTLLTSLYLSRRLKRGENRDDPPRSYNASPGKIVYDAWLMHAEELAATMKNGQDGQGQWLKIGQAAREHRLRIAARDLEHRWPGRYDFRIAALHGGPQAERVHDFALYLKHR